MDPNVNENGVLDLEVMFANDQSTPAATEQTSPEPAPATQPEAASEPEAIPFDQVVMETPAPSPAPAPQPATAAAQQPAPATPTMSAPVMDAIPNQTPMMAASAVQATAAVSTGVDENFSIDISEQGLAEISESGFQAGEIGMRVQSVPIERYRASENKVDRIGFISQQVFPVKMHYIEGVGSIMCFDGKCCDVAGSPQVRYLFPIVEYQTDSDGNITGGKVALKMLSAGGDLYKTIITLSKGSTSMGGIDKIDMLVTCTDEQFQKISLVQAGPAVWRQYPQIANFLKDKWTHDYKKAYQAICRKIDEETLARLMSLESTDVGPGQNINMSGQTDLNKFFQ